jgi:hypothetical protein
LPPVVAAPPVLVLPPVLALVPPVPPFDSSSSESEQAQVNDAKPRKATRGRTASFIMTLLY